MKYVYKNILYSHSAFEDVIRLRREVFCGESGEDEAFITDSRDEKAVHIACMVNDTVIGCGSLYDMGGGVYELSRIAVGRHFRRFGLGSCIMKELKKTAREKGASVLTARADINVLDFLEKNDMPHKGVPVKVNGKSIVEFEENLVFDGASWVEFGGEYHSVIARSVLELDKIPENAELFVTGLGFCQVYINGKRITDRELAPAWTNYVKADTPSMEYPIFDTMTNRIFYEKIQVKEFLREGKNTIVFHIGGGWFTQRECPNEGVKPYGNLMLCFKLMGGEKILAASGENVLYRKSFVCRANIYYGEDQDARIGGYDFENDTGDDEFWSKATVIRKPLSLLQEQTCTPDRIIRSLTPVCIYRKGDYAIYDIGENISGYPVVEFSERSPKGERCVLRFAEGLNADGSLNFLSAGGAFRMQKDTFIHDGVCKEYYPRFTWHGARYFDVLGNVNVKEYKVTHTDLKQIVTFRSSDETLQWIFDSYIRTQLSNVHGCVPSDCPHRERLGYTGDGQLTANVVMTCFDAREMYLKWMQDIADSQDIYTGHVQHTAPFYGGGGGPGGWGGAMVIVPYAFYKHYGDISVLEKYYPNMLMYLDYLESKSDNGLVMREELGGWCLGDWCSPGNKNLMPEPFVNTYFCLKTLQMTIEVSKLLGHSAEKLEARYEKVKKAFLENYYDEESCTFCGSLEASDAYGYDLGFGNEKTLKAIVDKYEASGEFDTGIFGTDILIRTLCENGYADTARRLLTSTKENSFYNMKKQGATTLWENWDGCDSHSHPMFGSVVEYIVKYFNEYQE